MRTNYIYNTDCIVGLKKHILDNSVDLCVTSPPYNVGIEYDNWDDCLRLDDYMGYSYFQNNVSDHRPVTLSFAVHYEPVPQSIIINEISKGI